MKKPNTKQLARIRRTKKALRTSRAKTAGNGVAKKFKGGRK